MLTNAMKLRLKDIACRLSESSDLLPGEGEWLVKMAEMDEEAATILDNARRHKLHDGVSGE